MDAGTTKANAGILHCVQDDGENNRNGKARKPIVEADGVEDGLHAEADVVEFALGDVLDAADVAAAEVVDDGVEAVAGVVALRWCRSRRGIRCRCRRARRSRG